jgi:hypothetical protein
LMASVPFDWMWRDPAEVCERIEEEIAPLLKAGQERELRNKRRRIRALVRAQKERQGKGQR